MHSRLPAHQSNVDNVRVAFDAAAIEVLADAVASYVEMILPLLVLRRYHRHPRRQKLDVEEDVDGDSVVSDSLVWNVVVASVASVNSFSSSFV